jgi:NAD-dependent deacetylase
VTQAAPYTEFEPLTLGPNSRVFVLTGAGLSAESGLATFRDAAGLWEGHAVEDVASPEGWARDPELVWHFYSERREQLLSVAPNAAHLAFTAQEALMGERLYLCTQNVDDLQERAGAQRVVHMHGELVKSRCERCSRPPVRDLGSYHSLAVIPRCACSARMRPHICWFGEVPYFMNEIDEELSRCDVFISVGTSGVVYPAAQFVRQAKRRAGVRAVYIGPEKPENGGAFDECRIGVATAVLPGLFASAPQVAPAP